MYTPRAFAETDLTGLDRLIERDAFVTLVTVADGLPFVSHLPVLYARDGDRIGRADVGCRGRRRGRVDDVHAHTAFPATHGVTSLMSRPNSP